MKNKTESPEILNILFERGDVFIPLQNFAKSPELIRLNSQNDENATFLINSPANLLFELSANGLQSKTIPIDFKTPVVDAKIFQTSINKSNFLYLSPNGNMHITNMPCFGESTYISNDAYFKTKILDCRIEGLAQHIDTKCIFVMHSSEMRSNELIKIDQEIKEMEKYACCSYLQIFIPRSLEHLTKSTI